MNTVTRRTNVNSDHSILRSPYSLFRYVREYGQRGGIGCPGAFPGIFSSRNKALAFGQPFGYLNGRRIGAPLQESTIHLIFHRGRTIFPGLF